MHLSRAQVAVLVAEALQLLKASLTTLCRAHIEQWLPVLTLRWAGMNFNQIDKNLPLFHFLRYPQHPFVDVISEFSREGQGNDNVGWNAKSFRREVLLVEA